MRTVSGEPVAARPAGGPRFLFHPSFEEAGAEKAYGDAPGGAESAAYMPDDATRACTRRMHYAAWRAATAPNRRAAARWRRRYFDCRDRIVLGNRKLIFRAVQKWRPAAQFADDLAGECHVVLIQAVAAYNPWLGVRFSTYAFTCLMRALSRLSQRRAADRLSRWMPLGSLPGGEPRAAVAEESSPSTLFRLDEYLREEHPLLSPREKAVLVRRYRLRDDVPQPGTLEELGREMGLSKERVRQLQCTALGKLRAALLAEGRGS
jgi:RNA polymerase sigma factor (sigma-70 family)